MSRANNKIWLAVAIAAAIVATVAIWGPLVTDPGNSCIVVGGDGGKNYFTYLYHALHGKGIWFRGMNYPYGEHIVYADAQPLLSVPLSYLPGVDFQMALTVMHLVIMMGYVLGIVFIYRLLKHFKVHPVLSICFAVLIVAISPQVEKVFGHFGLSYFCVVPMLFYWSVKYHALGRLAYPLFIFILGCIVSFLHPYFAALVFFWALFYAVSYFIAERSSFRSKLVHVIPVLLSAMLVVVIIRLFMSVTDPVTDRPQYPDGLLGGLTLTTDIVGNQQSPLSVYLQQQKLIHFSPPSEGAAYPGAVVLLTLLSSLLVLLFKKLRNGEYTSAVLNKSLFSPVWLLMALFSLLLAMGVPFIWGMNWLFDYASVFRQFRTLGRFSWMFFYITTIYSVVIIYHSASNSANSRGKRTLAISALAAAIAVWSFEASGYIKHIKERLVTTLSDNYFFLSRVERNWNIYLGAVGYKPADFQAVITAPYTHIGSEKIWLIHDNSEAWLQLLAWRVCVQTGLPMINVMMSRSSWSQTFAQVRIAGGPLADKPLLRINDERPFLLLASETDSITDPGQRYLVDAGEYIGTHGDLKAYKLYPAKLRDRDSVYRAGVLQLAAGLKAGDTCIQDKGPWYVDHFDGESNNDVLFGGGSMAPVADSAIIADMPFSPAVADQLYEFSAWVLVNDFNFRTPHIVLEYYGDNSLLLLRDIVHVSKSTDNHQMWMRASGLCKVPGQCRQLRCKVITDRSAYLALDELLIRPADATIISKNASDQVMVNNHLATSPR